ncbi:MAG: phosphoketolase family protein [Firmicutes bacterium]|nr:phosphoketolase family protein [Bacillota bacterium]
MENIDLVAKYFDAANYLSACQLYLLDNPLLENPLKRSDLKKKIVGHWGTVPGQNFIYAHLNRLIVDNDLNMIYVSGPGHGGNFMIANDYLDGSYTEKYQDITQDKIGMKKLFKQFSFPGGVPSHVAPETPGSIHEGGELGYSLAHSFGAVLDNPDLIVACVVGDGEAETGPLATSWQANKFINPKSDGIVLPILHLNGFKISNPTVLGRMDDQNLKFYFVGLGYRPYFVEGENLEEMHQLMAKTLDQVLLDIKYIKQNPEKKPYYPMIILRTPKGWTGPKVVNGKKIEGSFRAHQVPVTIETDEDIEVLEKWLRSYHPEKLFDSNGKLKEEINKVIPKGNRRMGANPIANGGALLKSLRLPDFRDYQVKLDYPGQVKEQDMLVLSGYIRDIFNLNKDNNNFRLFCPDEAMSNRLYKVFEATKRDFQLPTNMDDEYLSKNGKIMDSYLSEHLCQGMLEGYLLTGRHGVFVSYEAFIRIIDSMASQHAKWLKVCKEIPWRQSISSLNYILTSNVWQQDHNGFTHQDPGFIDHMVTKKADIVRVYLPVDANTLLSCYDHVSKTKDYINIIVASKHPSYQWLNMDEAIKHCTKGLGIWPFASNDMDGVDVVMACCGDTPTVEALAATQILGEYLPQVKVRFVNVIDLMKLDSRHPHGISDAEYDLLFTKDKPIIFAYHGYPSLIHELTYTRHNHNMKVAGYIEEGTITTPFDMRVLNKIDRYHLVQNVIESLPDLGSDGLYLYDLMSKKLIEHKNYIKEYGIDTPEIRDWKWQ